MSTSAHPPAVSAPGAPRPVTPGSILAARLAEILEQVERDHGDDTGLVDRLSAAVELAAGLDPYLDQVTSPESPALAELARRTAAEDWNGPTGNGTLEQEMLSGHVEGQLLQTLVHVSRARSVLDVGLFTGYSALAAAEALPADGRVVALEIDETVAAFARSCLDDSPVGAKVEIRVGPALAALDALAAEGERFDLVFLDADKGGYADYLDRVLEADLLAPHGLVVADNTLMQGEPWTSGERSPNGAAIAAFNAAVAADPRVEQVVVPLRDGLTLVRRSPTDRPDPSRS